MQMTSEKYKNLYHYTTWDGLLGILKSQSLWMTHYKFLNDYSEIVLFRDKLISLILPYVYEASENIISDSRLTEEEAQKAGGIDQLIHHDTEALVDAMYRATGEEIYILSFCGQHEDPNINNNGLLSQWRGYGADGGCALVFDTKKIEDLLELETQKFEYSAGHLSDVIYSDNEQNLNEEFSEYLSTIANDVKILIEHAVRKKEIEPSVKNSYIPFVNCISRYKHYGFKEENEVRVVALPTVINQKHIDLADKLGTKLKPEKERKFRNINGKHIPYIDLFSSGEIELPIEKIIIGPHKDKESRVSTLRVMLRKKDIEITCSEIPFIY